jgi:hypothetical protein
MKTIIFFIFLTINSITSAQETYTKILVNDQETNIISATKSSRIKIISNDQEYEDFDINCYGCEITKKEEYWIVVPSESQAKLGQLFLMVSARIDGKFYQIFRQEFTLE